jgi:hypothetical protein
MNNEPPEPFRTQIVLGLIEMRKAGKLYGIWLDGGPLRIKYNAWDAAVVLGWQEAADMTGVEIPPHKPMKRETWIWSTSRTGTRR